jgi:hypothetical protein
MFKYKDQMQVVKVFLRKLLYIAKYITFFVA